MQGRGSRLPFVWGGAVFLAALALLCWRGLSTSTPEPSAPSQKTGPALASEPVPEKAQPRPRYEVEREQRGGRTVEVVREQPQAEPQDPVAAFAARAVVPLTPEEETLLREEHVDGDMGALIAQLEHDFVHATPETRAAKEKRYLAALNLSAKLAPQATPAPDEEARALQARYLTALEAEQKKWTQLPPDEQRRQQDAFKDWFFRNAQAGSPR